MRQFDQCGSVFRAVIGGLKQCADQAADLWGGQADRVSASGGAVRIRTSGRPRAVDCRGTERVASVRRCSVGCDVWRLCHTSAAPPSIASVMPVT
ncbi:hypothetical protein GCM10010278_01640 [Streptomyces melanogenes]|nr:hypothetical protein GCM10010278_01640 [Streptomyces melanogenes]